MRGLGSCYAICDAFAVHESSRRFYPRDVALPTPTCRTPGALVGCVAAALQVIPSSGSRLRAKTGAEADLCGFGAATKRSH